MPIYEFTTDLTDTPRAAVPGTLQHPPGVSQLSDVQAGGRTALRAASGPDYASLRAPRISRDTSDIQEFVVPAFRALDGSMLMYWSGIRIPTKDSFRFLRVKIAGGDKSILVWNDELKNGRVVLPAAALEQGEIEFNKDKFSPAYLPMARRYLSRRGDRAALVYRPVPFLVGYTMRIWGEHKRDVAYALSQIIARFNPLAEFRMSDGHLQGTVSLRYGNARNATDNEVNSEQQQNVRYEVTMTAEAWLPLPERVIPTVLGGVVSIRERPAGPLLDSFGPPAVLAQ